MEINLIDYREQTIPPDTEEGIAVLDRGGEFWTTVLRGLAQHTNFIQADLSGGFDNRVAFVSLLNSGIYEKALFRSIDDNLHTHKEDFTIASQIATHYELKLNQPFPESQFLIIILPIFLISIFTVAKPLQAYLDLIQKRTSIRFMLLVDIIRRIAICNAF